MPRFTSLISTKKLVHIFAELEFHNYSYQMIESIRSELLLRSKEYILNVNEEEFIDSLESKYHLEQISFDFAHKTFDEPEKENFNEGGRNYIYYNFTLKIPFEGSEIILRLIPSQRSLVTYPIYIDHNRTSSGQVIYLQLKVLGKDKNEFDGELYNAISKISANLVNINKEVESWNNNLKQSIRNIFESLKNEYLSENEFYKSLDIKINNKSDELFNPTVIRKKIIPMPQVDAKTKKYSTSPTIDNKMYKDIVKTINTVCKTMERKPSIYHGRDEESLRDYILMFLETRYESATGTGETFNKSGKTDILLKHTDGSNLFVAECKFWHGEKKFLDTIDQLYGYLTWRDSKVAVIMFVENKDFSKIVDTMKESIKTHTLFNKLIEVNDETSFAYLFKFPGDSRKDIWFEVMLFHFPKD